MSGETSNDPKTPSGLPHPIIRKKHWTTLLIWLIPVAAAALAGYYAIEHHSEKGPEITIEFQDASGIKSDDSSLMYRGVEIGKITWLSITPDNRRAIVHVQLHHDHEDFAKQGARFWIVRPEISETNISGLGTLISGPFIQGEPGSGDATLDFTGLDRPPIESGPGIKVILHTPHLEHLQLESPVYFRGMEVGLIQDIRFSSDATEVNVTLLIWKRYQNLLRSNSVFWAENGADVKGGLFSGLKVNVKSLHALLTGGVAFATPDEAGKLAQDGASYALHEEPNKDWLAWSPKIPIEQEPSTAPADAASAKPGQDFLPAQIKKQ